MKVIASTKNGYLCEMSSREVYKVFNDTTPSLGDESDLEKLFETLAALRSLSKSQLSYLANNIKEFQKKFETIQDAYDKLMLLDDMRKSTKE